ncbi:MAG: glycosyltransferase family 2 protein [Candidatus Methanoperedens sp.]|nr:glycosyltransferase family 2 protein [Candidatus Methanoperedens sp.]
MSDSLSVVIPAYNEEKGIGKVLVELNDVLNKTGLAHEIIVVDDGSEDATAKIVQGNEFVKLVQHPANKGYGSSLKTGIRNATGKWILITDADGTYPVKDIPRLLEHIGNYDMVVGARTGKDVNIPLYRRPAKKILAWLANYLAETNIPDINSGMRVFRKEDALKFFSILPKGFSFTTTITMAYLSNDYTIKYLPIDYYRRHGVSKISPIRDFVNFAVLMIRTVAYFNPLKVFLPASIIFFVAGFLVLLYQIILYRNIADLPVMLLLAALQIGLMGLLADLIVRKRL